MISRSSVKPLTTSEKLLLFPGRKGDFVKLHYQYISDLLFKLLLDVFFSLFVEH